MYASTGKYLLMWSIQSFQSMVLLPILLPLRYLEAYWITCKTYVHLFGLETRYCVTGLDYIFQVLPRPNMSAQQSAIRRFTVPPPDISAVTTSLCRFTRMPTLVPKCFIEFMAMCIRISCHSLTLLVRTQLHRIAPTRLALSFPSHSRVPVCLNMSHFVYNDAIGVLDLSRYNGSKASSSNTSY